MINTGLPARAIRRGPAMLLAMALLACSRMAGDGRVDSLPATRVAAGAPQLLLQLERGACRGACPEYTVALRDDGSVEYTGVRSVAVTGTQRSVVDVGAVRRLHDALLAAGVATADAEYGIDSPSCGQYLPDTPVGVLTVRVNGAMKRVQYEAGCTGAPSYLIEFATRIDSLAATDRWVRRKEGTP